MKTVMKNEFQSSRIETLPFIRLDPSNPSTIYTALCFTQAQSEKHNFGICSVTFDQPLCQKATEIVAASRDLDKVVVPSTAWRFPHVNVLLRQHWAHNEWKWLG